jgi:hypothetical protein
MTRKRSLRIKPRILSASVLFIIVVIAVLTVFAGSAMAQNPVPFIDQPLVPDATAPGGVGFTLTVNGAGFVAASTVNWNGSPLATTFISVTQLTATVPASDIATASTASVTVVSPSPGGGVSNPQFFSIAVAKASVSFLPPVMYFAGGSYTSSVAIADLNGDGKLDLAATALVGQSNSDGSVGVLLGNGDGTFQPVVAYDSGAAQAQSVAVADVNGDGKPDLVVADFNNCAYCTPTPVGIAILLGNGDGTFQPALTYSPYPGAAYSVAVADLNGDGKLDIAAGVFSNVDVMLGNGDGTFQPDVYYSRGTGSGQAFSVAIADVNNDGVPDLVTSGFGNAEGIVSVLLGKGDGTFQPGVAYETGATGGGIGAMSVAVADLNGDGKPDLVVANFQNSTVGVLQGKGDGTFQPVALYSSGGSYAMSVAVADMNGDGRPDVVVGNYYGTVGVLLGNGDGTLQPALSLTVSDEASSVAVADVNGDGRPDILVTNLASSTVGVLLNNASSSLQPTTTALASSLNPSTYGQSVTFTATVSSSAGTPTETVELYNGSAAIGNGTLTGGKTSIPVSSLPAGSDSITAVYQGSLTFASSTSSPLIQTVRAATTSTGLTSSLNPAGANQSVTFTATVTSQFGGAATGSVTFFSGSQTLGTASLSGKVATLNSSFSASGTYAITAHYSGDTNNTASTSATLNEKIIASTTTALTSSPNPAMVGQTITFTATVTSNSGTPPNGETVTFYNGSAVLGTGALSAGIASFATASLPAGVYSITASYPGDSNFAASTSTGLRQAVNTTTKSTTSTALASTLNPSTYGQKVTWTAKVTTLGPIPPTGKVNFKWGGNSIGTATLNASGVATLSKSNLNVYTYPLTAVYSGDANNTGSTSPILNQVVKETTSAATLSSSPNPSTQGQAVTFTATITSPTVTATGPVTFTAGKTVLGTAQLSGHKATFTTSTLPVGSTTVTATYNGDSNIAESSASVTQTVQQ